MVQCISCSEQLDASAFVEVIQENLIINNPITSGLSNKTLENLDGCLVCLHVSERQCISLTAWWAVYICVNNLLKTRVQTVHFKKWALFCWASRFFVRSPSSCLSKWVVYDSLTCGVLLEGRTFHLLPRWLFILSTTAAAYLLGSPPT